MPDQYIYKCYQHAKVNIFPDCLCYFNVFFLDMSKEYTIKPQKQVLRRTIKEKSKENSSNEGLYH